MFRCRILSPKKKGYDRGTLMFLIRTYRYEYESEYVELYMVFRVERREYNTYGYCSHVSRSICEKALFRLLQYSLTKGGKKVEGKLL